MTDDLESAVVECTDDSATIDEAEAARESARAATVGVPEPPTDTDAEMATAEIAVDDAGGDEPPPDTDINTGDDETPVTPARRRRVSYLVGTLLIAAGVVMIALTVGITGWKRHARDAETRAFLSRVTTPTALPASIPRTTPFPSTISGALVPDTARTPTANVATRAAQPVATTSSGVDRSIIAAPPAPKATPASVAPTAGDATIAPPPTPKPRMPKPSHIAIPAIKVDSDIVEVGVSPISVDGREAYIWDVAPYAVGHHFSSADPGEGENVVLSGHDDWQGEVFKNLYKLKKGDEIDVQAGDRQIGYHVDEILLLPEVGEPLEKRLQNAAFIGTTGDERLTLVTCWPYAVDDHRLIVIARPDK